MSISRRDFIKDGLLTLSLPWQYLSSLIAPEESLVTARKAKILVIVQLLGGNDGLNTVIPYNTQAYYRARPTLAIPAGVVLPLTAQIGFHPSLAKLDNLYKDSKLAIIQGVGYPTPSFSHARSLNIWQTGQTQSTLASCWLNKHCPKILGICCVKELVFLPPGTTLQSNGSIFDDLVSQQSIAKINYPNSLFGQGLKAISQLVAHSLDYSAFVINLSGFDTHNNQKDIHAKLLKELADGLVALWQDIDRHAKDKDLLILVYSEFGRQLAENNEYGTNHGTAQPIFVIGNSVVGGVWGEHPDLSSLDEDNLRYTIDFRSIYATILERWFEAESQDILGSKFNTIPFL